MTSDPARSPDLLGVKLAALVRHRWSGAATGATPATFPGGASLVDPADGSGASPGGRACFLLDGVDPHSTARRLGPALAVAGRAHVDEIHVLSEDVEAAAVLARRCALFAPAPTTWWVDGVELRPATPALPAAEFVPSPAAELYRPVLDDAGLTTVTEGAVLIGEWLGLEVARVIDDADGGAHLEPGVGRADREAGALVWAELGAGESLERVRDLVAEHRHPGAEPHPLNQLVPERWLRAILVANPSLVGARRLEPVGSAVARRNLREVGVASAVGERDDGSPMVVTCSTGVDLDLVPAAADDRLAHSADAHLVLVVPARDAASITVELAGRLAQPAEVIAAPDDWTTWSDDPVLFGDTSSELGGKSGAVGPPIPPSTNTAARPDAH